MSLLDLLTFGWLKNLTGIRKDKLDIEKGKLEIQKLKEDEVSRNLITRATMDDIEKYDPKIKKIREKSYQYKRQTLSANPLLLIFLLVLIIVFLKYCSAN